ncbi:acyltransferase [bacterium]|nr:MAG: acyltransferase [bacterium]
MTAHPSDTNRLHFPHLDAIRGIAALCVLIFHIAFSSALSPVWLHTMPSFVNSAGHVLANGVEVFFVLSGWVIAHSMRWDNLEMASLGRFLVRRTLRLTPAYWAALVLTLVLGVVGIHLGSGDSLPSISKIGLNFLYLQNIFGVGNVFSPAWTLCIEAQFYVAFAAILWMAVCCGEGATGAEPFGKSRGRLAALLFASALGTLALACRWNDGALFVSWWFYFAGGALGYLASRDSRFMPMVAIVVAAMAGVSAWLYLHPVRFDDEGRSLMVGTLALLFLLVAHGRARWTEWSRRGLFAWLGNISYSLYLTHFGFGLLLARAFRKISHQNALLAVVFIFVDIAFCLLLAHFFWRWIEQPSVEWAKGFKLKGNALRERAGAAA